MVMNWWKRFGRLLTSMRGTIYPILKRLTNEGYFETYLEESNEGPTRKYYHITVLGRQHQEEVLEEWNLFSEKINHFL